MLTMFHGNSAKVKDGLLYVDRKFLSGMRYYVDAIDAPLTSIHPEAMDDELIMDMTQVPLSDLGFKVVTVNLKNDVSVIDKVVMEHISKSLLVYGHGMGIARIARQHNIPFILTLEHDLATKVAVSTNSIDSKARRFVRTMRSAYEWFFSDVPAMRYAHSLHCNGYPVHAATATYNCNRLLYLDSRMSSDDVISEVELASRLAELQKRPVRLLYTGRYEPIKGAVDAVKVAVECQRLGLDIEFHCYGQGRLHQEMVSLARTAPHPERISIHAAIPYPELVKRSREFDIFVSCHVQNDPSCTYIETLGSGLPIVGYENKMLKGVIEQSMAGFFTKLGSPAMVARQIAVLVADKHLLAEMSYKARSFSLKHVFEHEFGLRVEALKAAYSSLSARS